MFASSGSNDGPPTVVLTSPADGDVLTEGVDATGTATDSDLAAYYLEARRADVSGDFTEIARGTTPVTSGVLGLLDTGRVGPGEYDLRLRAVDSYGNVATTPTRRITVQDTGSIGNLRFTVSLSGVRCVSIARTTPTTARSGTSASTSIGASRRGSSTASPWRSTTKLTSSRSSGRPQR